jgi:hypothetical protein
MGRQLTASYSHFKTKNEYTYQPAFGTHTRGERDVKQQINKIYNETGRRIEEVGNSEPTAVSRETSIDMQDIAEHYRSIKRDHQRKGLL